MIMQDLSPLESLFLALSDKTRLRLLALMADGEVSVGYLAEQLGESQPKISRHLAYLRGAGLVSTRRDGKWVYYAIETQQDSGAEDVLGTAIGVMQTSNGRPYVQRASNYTSNDSPSTGDTYAEAYTDEWSPAELDIFLL